jgi:YHS domain-containing protein
MRWNLSLLAASLMGVLFLLPASLRAEEAKPDAPKKDPKDMTLDELQTAELCPVCHKAFKLVYHFEIGDKTYHFATRDCQKAFGADPAKFGAKPAPKKDTPAKTPAPKDAPKDAPKEGKSDEMNGEMMNGK